ncbi:acyltransferase [Raoultella planticola]|uniref:acyltransferase family protein n=1 Tax=Raoultella planticola TaxID=575 RepID=UPI0010E886A1|nr:acyltransferase [Raoultella planticola]EIY2678225.1 acyltransferase [Raoultella planticola]VTM98080.1 Uncharacterized protein conserved in bacteria [Raoultella planticola]
MGMRDKTIDIMRVIGIMLIILAHVSPPEFLFQLRTFDVPMMIFISGMSYYVASKKDVKIVPYVKSRFRRLVVPAWIFITLFYITIYVFNPEKFYDIKKTSVIISSYLLNGFGYFWIIRIFLIIAIISPFLAYVMENKNSGNITIITLAMLIVATILSLVTSDNGAIWKIVNQIIIPTLSYSSVFMIGYKWVSFNNKERLAFFMVYTVIFTTYFSVYLLYKGNVPYPQSFKYPPTLYFIIYALMVTLPLYLILSKLNIKGRTISKSIFFLSSNTIWIYLWHIPIVEYLKRYNPTYCFEIKYIIAFVIPIIIVLAQVNAVKYVIRKNPKMKFLNVFTG